VDRARARDRQTGGEALGVRADITRQEDVERVMDETLGRFGRLDVLVNNAGRVDARQGGGDDARTVRELLELNFIALVRCTRAALPSAEA